ncbi:MAG TPA: S-layer homology domain-containing protein, partial [Clostridia bacterium]
FNAVSGKITSYNSSWFNTAFENKDKVIPVEKIYEKLFNEIGLELLYRSEFPNGYHPGALGKKTEIKLVYSIKAEKPAAFDANSGTIINSDGKPYKDSKPQEYKDIKGHYAEKQIKVLQEYGISLDGDELRPDSDILQKDFVKLLSSVLNYYTPALPQPLDSKNQSVMTEEMYKVLIREGIMKAEEKAPDAVVTREDSVKFLIRALKYDKVAGIKGIFNCSFKDKDKINSDLVGYVVIADGLNIIKGSDGLFNPKKALTRAQAIIEAYNYLQI